jgi:hypothetical protein
LARVDVADVTTGASRPLSMAEFWNLGAEINVGAAKRNIMAEKFNPAPTDKHAADPQEARKRHKAVGGKLKRTRGYFSCVGSG